VPTTKEAADTLVAKILALAEDPAENASAILRLAEAWAWLMSPSQPHGGTAQR
jgi:hypothetical protein